MGGPSRSAWMHPLLMADADSSRVQRASSDFPRLTMKPATARVGTAASIARYPASVSERLRWDASAAEYIRSRGDRYPGSLGIEPEWTLEAMADTDLLALEPDPKSRMGASRFIGHSTSAGRVLVVIAYRDLDGDLHGINAWPASGADLVLYHQGENDVEDD